MKLKTQLFQEACKTILMAVDNTAANLELATEGNNLYLNVTNKESYVSIKYELETPEDFRATVSAPLFLNLISGITTDDFDLVLNGNVVNVKSGKSNYKVAMIYENDELMKLPKISIENVSVEMPINIDILRSIVNVNGKELQKVKNLDVSELQKLYYIDENGCFTFTSGACLNSFSLEKPVKMLLNDRIVKLFKLFKTDVQFGLGHDMLPNGTMQTKIALKTDDTYVAAIITNDDLLINKIQGPCTATKNYIAENYAVRAVLSVKLLSGAIARLMSFTKNSVTKANMMSIFTDITINANEMSISDKLGNTEVVPVENGSTITDDYKMAMNIVDLKLVLDSCKEDHITLNCGNHRSIVVNRGTINNLIPEVGE